MATRTRIVLQSDVVGAAGTNFQPATGMAFDLILGKKYHVRLVALTTAAATTTGVVMGISANPTTAATVMALLLLTADGVGTLDGGGVATYQTTASTTGTVTAPTDTPSISGNLSVYEGIIVPAATQVGQVEFRSEASAATTIKAGSFIDIEELI